MTNYRQTGDKMMTKITKRGVLTSRPLRCCSLGGILTVSKHLGFPRLTAGAATSLPLPPSHSETRPVSLHRLVSGRCGIFRGPEEVGEAVAGLIRLRSALRIAGRQARCLVELALKEEDCYTEVYWISWDVKLYYQLSQ